jgi:chromosome segregation ATPase
LEREVNDDLNKGKMIQNLGKTDPNAPATSPENAPFLVKENSMQKLDNRVLATSSESGKKKEEELNIDIELPEQIKEQLEIKMELAVLDEKKTTLKNKLKEITDNLSDDRYDNDIDYAQQINVKLNALKQLKQELEEKEEQLRKDLGGNFKVDELEEQIALKRQQLIELKRSYKHNQVKKDIYDQLKQEYADQFMKAEQELQDLRTNIIRWLSKERAEKSRVESHIRLLQGRLKAHEIVQQTFDEQKSAFDKDIEKLNQKIKILEAYSREKKKKFF